MSRAERCAAGGPTKAKNGNCTIPDPDDGLPVQCVGPWVKQKHHYARAYIELSSSTRGGYLPGRRAGFAGGAAFIDLFAGPGRARIFSSGELVDGSPLIALAHSTAPFTKVILCDIDEENVAALRSRTAKYAGRAIVVPGSCHFKIDEILSHVPRFGLNFALVDPFGLSELLFPTLAKLARFERMDLIINFPTMDATRNFAQGTVERLSDATGNDDIDALMVRPRDATKAIPLLRDSLKRLGYTGYRSIAPPVRNTKNGLLYHLVHASKAGKGDAIWSAVAKTSANGQGSLW